MSAQHTPGHAKAKDQHGGMSPDGHPISPSLRVIECECGWRVCHGPDWAWHCYREHIKAVRAIAKATAP